MWIKDIFAGGYGRRDYESGHGWGGHGGHGWGGHGWGGWGHYGGWGHRASRRWGGWGGC